MKDRGKAVVVETYKDKYTDFNYSAASDIECKKHPSSSSVGICAQCLKERLIKLVCSDCGEQRLSSCSCSEISSNPKLSNVDVGSVGRISFLIENDQITSTDHQSNYSKPRNINGDRSEDIFFLKRSSSSCIQVKKVGFWKIGRFFRKKRGGHLCDDESGVNWMFDNINMQGVSRSRSLCSFRGGVSGVLLLNDQDESSEFAFSSAKVSDFNGGGSESRKSGARGSLDYSENGVIDVKCLKKGGTVTGTGTTTDLDSRDSALFGTNTSVFPVKESDFNSLDDSNFIDLKLDLLSSSESKTEYSAPKLSDLSDSDYGFAGSLGSLLGDGIFGNGGSCRITTVNDEREEIKRVSKGHNKVWRWIFKHHQGGGWRSATTSKRDENHILKL